MAATTQQDKLVVKIFSPFQSFFEGSAVSVSARNKTGAFDVLYGHSNFFSLLNSGRIRVNTGFETVDIEVEGGVIRVNKNRVVVFANV